MSPDLIMACTGSSLPLAQRWADPLTFGMDSYAINTPQRQAAFLAQIGHESGSLQWTREIWGPTPAQTRYEGRTDLGNNQPGDGKRFMGRGFIQITGRANYTNAAEALCLDLLEHPEILEDSPQAAISACWWWATHGLNELADGSNMRRISVVINGGTTGLADRLARWSAAKQAFGIV